MKDQECVLHFLHSFLHISQYVKYFMFNKTQQMRDFLHVAEF